MHLTSNGCVATRFKMPLSRQDAAPTRYIEDWWIKMIMS